jgi:hypothetical protein
MNQHEHFHFSVTVQSEELFMVSAMRRLAWQCQPQINRQIAAAGTGNDNWKHNQGNATFYFTSAANRREFLKETALIFLTGWKKLVTTKGGQRFAKIETVPPPDFHGDGEAFSLPANGGGKRPVQHSRMRVPPPPAHGQ